MNKKIPVLMYHAICNEQHPPGTDEPGDLVYVLHEEQFHTQMKLLSDQGFESISIDDILLKKNLPTKPIILTFDDGHETNCTVALPIMKKFGFTSEIYVTTDWTGKPYYLSEEQIRQLSREGAKIGSHGASHLFFDDLSQSDAKKELCRSKEILERITGKEINAFAAPGGRYNKTTISLLKECGYTAGYTSRTDYLCNGDPYAIPRIAIKQGMGIVEFEKIVNQNTLYILKSKLFNGILRALKLMLGNHLYTKLRSCLLKK